MSDAALPSVKAQELARGRTCTDEDFVICTESERGPLCPSCEQFARELDAFAQEVARETLSEALEAVTAEHLSEPQDDTDEAYDRAICDARQAIGKLFHARASPLGVPPRA